MGRSAGRSWTGGKASPSSSSKKSSSMASSNSKVASHKAKKRKSNNSNSISSIFVNADGSIETTSGAAARTPSPRKPIPKQSRNNNNASGNKKAKQPKAKNLTFPQFSAAASSATKANKLKKKGKGSTISKLSLKSPPPYPSSPKSNHHKRKQSFVNLNDYAKQQQELKKNNHAKQQQSKKRKRSSSDNYDTNNAVVRGFALQLPCKHAGKQVSQIPWMTAAAHDAAMSAGDNANTTRNKKLSSNNNISKKKVRLPTDDIDPAWLEHLNAELVQFAKYVRLTPTERKARFELIQQLTDLCNGISNFDACPDDIFLQPFGSFAAPDVCTFDSDVDLALWGAVSILPSSKRKLQKQLEKQQQQQQAAAASAQPNKNNSADRKRQRQQEWQQALARIDEENILSPGNDPSSLLPEEEESNEGQHQTTTNNDQQTSPTAAAAEPKTPPNKSAATATADTDGGDDDSIGSAEELFVIDRKGDEVNDDQNAGEEAAETRPVEPVAKEESSTKEKSGDVEPQSLPGSSNSNHPSSSLSSVGHSTETAIDVPGDSSSSDEDDADKLEGLKERSVARDGNDVQPLSTRNDRNLEHLITLSSGSDHDDGHEEEDEAHVEERYKDELAGVHFEHEEEEEDDDDHDHLHHEEEDDAFQNLEVGFINGRPSTSYASSFRFREQQISPEVRKRDAVDALSQLDRRLRRAKLFSSIQFVRHARVPIIKFVSKLGVEVDISIGGQNGADTSLYAAQQTARYASFAPVVLALKIIMGQQNLDTPFTGGLGSFKLYVLVAHHIQQHLSMGGFDQPGEILLGFLFRYGGSAIGDHCIESESARTLLSQDVQVICKDTGCDADLSNVYKVEECCHLFTSAWRRLWSRMRKTSTTAVVQEKQFTSLLAELIFVDRLAPKRNRSLKNAVDATKSGAGAGREEHPPNLDRPPQQKQSSWPAEKTAQQLAAGYGMKLPPHGRLSKRLKT